MSIELALTIQYKRKNADKERSLSVFFVLIDCSIGFRSTVEDAVVLLLESSYDHKTHFYFLTNLLNCIKRLTITYFCVKHKKQKSTLFTKVLKYVIFCLVVFLGSYYHTFEGRT